MSRGELYTLGLKLRPEAALGSQNGQESLPLDGRVLDATGLGVLWGVFGGARWREDSLRCDRQSRSIESASVVRRFPQLVRHSDTGHSKLHKVASCHRDSSPVARAVSWCCRRLHTHAYYTLC